MSNESALNPIEIEFEKNVYSLETIKKAAYKFSNQVSFDFKDSGQKIVCVVNFKANETSQGADEVVFLFKNEVLDQDLREKISAKTENVRNLILAHTFSNTGIR